MGAGAVRVITKCRGEGCRVRNRCTRHTTPMGPYLLWEYQVIPPHDIKQRKRGCEHFTRSKV